MDHTSYSPWWTKEQIGVIALTPPEVIPWYVTRSKQAYTLRSSLPISERVNTVGHFLSRYTEHKDQLATLMSQEIGKPITQAYADIDYDLTYIRYYLEHAEAILAPETVYQDTHGIHTLFYAPRGVAASISPRNYPTSQFVRQVIPPLLAGNTVIYKPSHLCLQTGKMIAQLLASYLPEDVFLPIYGWGDLGEQLVAADIDCIIFTGSTSTGAKILSQASSGLKKTFLELGGSAPGIILPDACIDQDMMNMISYIRRRHAGQICDGLKRMIVHVSRYEELLAAFTSYLASKKVGNPLDPETRVGCIVNQDQYEKLHQQLEDATSKWAHLIQLGAYDGTPGPFLLPTLVLNPTQEMRIMREEVFGPVLPIMTYQTREEAITLANATEYGLGGYLRGKNYEELTYVCSNLTTWNISVNNTSYLLPQIPFGWHQKASGNCRQHGVMGLREYCEVKVVSQPADPK